MGANQAITYYSGVWMDANVTGSYTVTVTGTAPAGITLTQSNPTATVNVGTGTGGRVQVTITAPSNGNVTLQGTAGTSNDNDPALYNSAGIQIAYQNNGYNFIYTIYAGQTVTVYAGTGGNVARSYVISSTWPTSTATVTVTFNSGGASGTLPSSITVNAGQAITVPGRGNLRKSGSFFNGWKVNGTNTIYYTGNKPTISTNVTLVAQWVKLEGGQYF